MTIHAAPKPTPITEAERRATRIASVQKLQRSRKPIKRSRIEFSNSQQGTPKKKIPKSNSVNRAKRARRNREYYASAEWRAKKKAVHERDGYRCVEMILYYLRGTGYAPTHLRCPNFGMNINGKQTAKGLVCEEVSYGHRGIPDRIDTCITRCKDCDRRLTPLERANHAGGFRK